MSGEGPRTPSPKPRNSGLRSSSNPQTRNPRENSPAPNLADLEFPPPPPPLEDDAASALDDNSSAASHDSIDGPKPRDHTPPTRPIPSPRGQIKTSSVQMRASSVDRVGGARQSLEDQFFLGEEVSIEENSLKRNIDSNRVNRESVNDSPNTTTGSAHSGGLVTSKSADSLSSSELLERKSGGTPFHSMEETGGGGGGGIMSQSIFGILRSPSPWEDNQHGSDPPPEPAPSLVPAALNQKTKPSTPRGLRHVDAQLVAELKEKTDKKPSGGSSMENVGQQNPPSVHLVSELFENLRLKAGKKPGFTNETQTTPESSSAQPAAEVMAPPPPRPVHPAPQRPASHSGTKKVDLTAEQSSSQDQTNSSIVAAAAAAANNGDGGVKFDFKSRLRKVANEKPEVEAAHDQQQQQPVAIKPVVKPAPEKADKSAESSEDCDDKRKSSGSINSLKRMWEKDQQVQQQQQQPQQQPQSQRISLKSGANNAEPIANSRPPPPPQQQPDKPAVPVKPSSVVMKPLGKNSSAAIYATPTSSVINAKPPVANRSSAVYAKGPAASMVIQSSVGGSENGDGDRQKIVALCSEVEQVLSQSHATPNQWMELLSNVHSLCQTYADCIAPHGRFHFRQLIAKLETQTKEMKQTSCGPLRNSSEHSRLVGDVKNTVRDVANALQR